MSARLQALRGSVWSAAFVLVALPLAAAAAKDAEWITFEDCRLLPNEANDGDSFHVMAKDKEYVFRLYFVDAPETAGTNPARLIEQAKYFEITVPQAIEVGELAKTFAQEKLSKPFTVLTRMKGGMGRGKIQRFYALVKTKEGDLGEQLVENGLARVHGTGAKRPGFTSSKVDWEKLTRLETEAKREKIGGWGANFGRLNARVDKTSKGATLPARAGESPAAPVESPASDKKAETSKLDVNSASEQELQTVPGIGPAYAHRIIAARPFQSADDLKRVKGLGAKQRYARIRPYFK